MSVAYQGAEGAFSHEACLRFLPEHEPIGFETFADVAAAVCGGDFEFGILPLANNEAGETGARALIQNSQLRIVEERMLPIRMHLLAIPSAKLDQLRTVVSHPVALRQCARSLSAMGLRSEEASNTAIAAKALTSPSRGVLASETAASLYGLAILKRDMQDRDDNATNFAIIARGRE